MIDVVLGLQWGDEGKGKIVDYLAPHYDVVARFQGGPNAGHTLYINDKKLVLHQIPSGILHSNIKNLIGSGVVLDVVTLQKELEMLQQLGYDATQNLYLSERTSLIVPSHRLLDKASEISKGNQSIGSTLKGIGPAYMDVTGRNAIRVGDILCNDFPDKYQTLKSKHQKMLDCYDVEFDESFQKEEALFLESVEKIKQLNIVNGEYWINSQLNNRAKILAEGAQGSMLDITFGTYPYVTSSHTLSGGVCTGLGVSPKSINKIYGVTKAYCTRVGNGPFPTELNDKIGEEIRAIGNEYGATTGRPRGCGWLDLVALKYACMINGVTDLIVTKIDVLNSFEELKICTNYTINSDILESFPFEYTSDISPSYQTVPGWNSLAYSENFSEELNDYLTQIILETGVQISHVSYGANRNEIAVL